MSYVVYIRNHIDKDLLIEQVALFFDIDTEDIDFLEGTKASSTANIAMFYYDRGFLTRLDVYREPGFMPHRKEIDFSLFLAGNLNCDVLISYWDDNPFAWILVKPDGSIYKVREIPSDLNEGIEINLEDKAPLTFETVWGNTIY